MLTRSFQASLLAVSALIALEGCGEPTEPEVVCEPSTAVLTPTVEVGIQVTVDWVPACDVFVVLVEPADAADDIWGLITEGRNGISPPVIVGSAPDGVELIVNEELEPGREYGVYLIRLLAGEEVLAGSATFTR